MFERLKEAASNLKTITYWDMGQGGRVGEAYASACTQVTSGFSGEGADFQRFEGALQLLT